MGQQHDFYLVQSGNLVPRAALWRGFLACFQQPSLLRPANLDSSDLKYLTADDDSGEDYNASFRIRLIKGRTYVLRIRLYWSESSGETAVMMW